MIVDRMGIAGGGPCGQWPRRLLIAGDCAASTCSMARAATTVGWSGNGPGAFGSPRGVSSHRQTREWSCSRSSPGSAGEAGTSQPQWQAPTGQQQQLTGAASFDTGCDGEVQLSGPMSCAKMRSVAFIATQFPEPLLVPGNSPAPVCPAGSARGLAGDESDRIGNQGGGATLKSLLLDSYGPGCRCGARGLP